MTALLRNDSASQRRPRAIDVLRTSYIYGTLWLGLTLFIVLLGPFLLLAAYTIDRQRRTARRAARLLFPNLIRHYCWLARQPMRVDPAPFDWKSIGPCIVVANHASIMDSVLLMALPPGVGDGRVWAKGWPFRVPLLGWLMRLSGHLFVEDFNILPDAQSCLADGSSLLVFPESSRTRTGKVARFREGAFLLAARTGFPIVPVAIHGSFECLPPGQSWIFRPRLRIQPLAALYPDAADSKSHAELRRQARALIAQALGQSTEAVLSPNEPAAA
jgi:1-acyl-sn-glycerol-3-phosphate acyltransferase